MGKDSRRKASADQFESSDADSLSSVSTTFSDLTMTNETEHVSSVDFQLEKYIDALYEKRGSVRETALLGLAEAFEGQVLLPFIENKWNTLLHQYLASIKKGSSKEACLASRTIGLLAITVGAGNSAHEIMEESIYPLSQALVSGSDKTKKKAVIDCLALITFIGANDLIETEGSLKIIWQVIYPKSGPNVGSVKKPDSAVLSSAISAWSFLLTTIGGWRINPDSWKESISFLSNLLEDPDRSVRIAAGEALGLFFELGILDMNYQREDTNIEKLECEISKHGAFHHLQGLKAKILARASALSTEAGGKGTDKKNLNDQRELFQKFLDFVETGDCPETLLKISRKQRFLTTSTWAQMLQLNFFKSFLGKGFLKHAQDNELLHDIFDFAQDRMGILSTREKFSRSDDKGWTQKMNKDRKLAQARKQGHLICEDD